MKTLLIISAILVALTTVLSFGLAVYFLWFYLTTRPEFGFVIASLTMAFFGGIGVAILGAVRRIL